MNEHEVGKLLGDVVPTAPSTKGWAHKAAGRVRRRRVLTGAAAVLVALGLPAGFLLSQQQPLLEATPQPADTATSGPVELTGQVMIFQSADAELPHLCLGAVMESYPPQCNGPTLKGDFSWDEVKYEESGTRWTNESYTVFGYYDAGDGENGSFTLSRPVGEVAPPPAHSPMEFSALCADPLRGGDESLTGMAAQEALQQEVLELPLVGLWVSDGTDFFNVRVQGDAEAAHAQLRKVWGGELCVESSDAPTEAERQAAADRIMAALPEGQFLGGSGGNGLSPVVDVMVVVADAATESTIREAAGPGVEVQIAAVFTPVDGSTAGPTTDASATAAGTEPAPSASPAEPSAPTSVDPDTAVTGPAPTQSPTLTGNFAIYQYPDSDLPHLCNGNVGYSMPPKCTGPTLQGDFSWDELAHEAEGGTRWTNESFTVIGLYDPDDGPAGSFTLTEPVAPATEEPGFSLPDELATVCSDPQALAELAGGKSFRVDRSLGGEPGQPQEVGPTPQDAVLAEERLCPVYEQQPTGADVDAAATLMATNPAPSWLVDIDPKTDFLHVQVLAETERVSETVRGLVADTGVPVVITKRLTESGGPGEPMTIVLA
ncbi:hypothetical protein LKO27_14245 [Tessaracoccus sp. OS52]|uniref:hypothetical protein n=1 Tax=Tessaracoccus sp. OS52 TaxID=2886691 RepID=UPI001D108B45|nr:hypothetical protein [Tessaracoccus sp. OS52]MCC2594563.1 hypothetical protein [Tessaracoccus sp. OS52]